MPLREAVQTACRVRLRPILMTSLATVIGLVPMALKLGTGSEAYAPLARAIGRDLKGKLSPVLYLAGIVAASFSRENLDLAIWVALAFFVATAVVWLVPDRRIERVLVEEHRSGS